MRKHKTQEIKQSHSRSKKECGKGRWKEGMCTHTRPMLMEVANKPIRGLASKMNMETKTLPTTKWLRETIKLTNRGASFWHRRQLCELPLRATWQPWQPCGHRSKPRLGTESQEVRTRARKSKPREYSTPQRKKLILDKSSGQHASFLPQDHLWVLA